MKVPATGGCQCGAVRYEIAAPPVELFACHCIECRRQSGSIHGLSLIVPRAGFSTNGGPLATWSRGTDSGNVLHCRFCATCGTRIWHESDPRRETVSVKAGTLDEAFGVSRAVRIWTSRMLPGVVLPPGVTSFDGEPE